MKSVRFPLIWSGIYFALTIYSSGQDYERTVQLYDQIKSVSFDEEKVAQVESLVLKRDVAVFRLKQGRICLFQPIQGKVTGAVFLGEGTFEFSPATEIEKYQLERFTHCEKLSEEFTQLYLLFSDTTGLELEHNLIFSADKVSGKAKSRKKNCSTRILRETGRNLWCRVLGDILADSSFSISRPQPEVGFFYADIKTDNLGPLFFTFDPEKVEEVALEKPDPRPGIYARDLVCSFHRAEDYLRNSSVKNTPIPYEAKDRIKVSHYKMQVEINIAEELSADVEIDFEAQIDGMRLIDFDLHPDLQIDGITNERGDSLPFVKEGEDQWGVSVVLFQPTKSGQSRKLTFKYSGEKIIDQDRLGDLYIRSSTLWYPRYGHKKRATYDMIFKSPKGYEFVSIGRKTKEWIEGDFLCTQWVEEIPVAVASFNYGHFDIYEKEVEGIPSICVYHLEQSHRRTGTKYKRSKESVAADLINSLNFFQKIYGKCPFPRMAATETPTYGGQGLPGLLRLSWGTFMEDEQYQETRFLAESFRAHEVSHQWWGHTVGWETYHDQWISEGFAEYSGAWYAQMSTKDNEVFFDQLEEWRKDIMGKGVKWAEGSKVGPIWLGYRLNSSKSDDYWNLIYKKGAYILHMLRNMMMDYNTKSDDRFKKMMADFVETHRGKNASTEDFKAVVEEHVGEDMDWFFNQWVYGVEIPTYRFSHATEKTPEGKYVVTCQITPENVSEDFKMWVPILLDFGGGQYAVLRLLVDKPRNEYKLPKAPLKPRKVILNPFGAVLCEVKNK